MGFCWAYKYRWYSLLIPLTVVLAIGVGAGKIVQTADYKVYFNKNDPGLIASDKLAADYSKSDNVLFVIAPKDKNVFSKKTLLSIQKLTKEAWQVPFSSRVDSITNFQHSHSEKDDLIISNLVNDAASISQPELEKVKKIALNEPELLGRIINPAGSVTGVNVTINFSDGKVDSQTREVVKFVRKLRKQVIEENPDLDVYLTGIVMMNNAFPESSEQDGQNLVPLVFLFILGGIYFLFRSATATFATLVVILLSIVTAMGFAGWAGLKINPASGAAPIIILTLAVADCVHILSTIFYKIRVMSVEKKEAVKESLEVNFKPVVVTSVTTAIGFLSMNFSDAPPFRDLGNITAVGILAGLVLSLTVLPALVNLMKIKDKKSGHDSDWIVSVLKMISGSVIGSPLKYLVVLAVISVAVASMSVKNELNEDFIRYFDKSFDVRKSTEFTLNNLTGVGVIEYDVLSGKENGIYSPGYMQNLDKLTQWYRSQPEVSHVSTFSDTIKRINKDLNYNKSEYYSIPDSQNLMAQYVLLYENSLPQGLGITDRVKLDKSATRLTVTTKDINNNELLGLEKRASAWMAMNLPQVMQAPGLGWSVMFGGIAKNNIYSMLFATLLAVILVSVILIFTFRSVKLGVISLIPNLLPAMVAMGIWGATVGMIGLAASIITAMTFGIVVDDTIHFINRYLHNRRILKLGVNESIHDCYMSVGKAMIITSLALMAGFLVLSGSGFKINSIIGVLSALTLGVALVLDLLMLPALLIKLDAWFVRDDEKETPIDMEVQTVKS